MDLYLIRHAEAHPLNEHIADDAERPLTDAGRDATRALAQTLTRLGVQLDVLATSPLLRTRQTAEELLTGWPAPVPELRVAAELAPGGKRRKIALGLRKLGKHAIGLVGHQPDLGELAGWLIGSRKAQIDFDKAGVALIRCADEPGKSAGSLVWLATPAWFVPG